MNISKGNYFHSYINLLYFLYIIYYMYIYAYVYLEDTIMYTVGEKIEINKISTLTKGDFHLGSRAKAVTNQKQVIIKKSSV